MRKLIIFCSVLITGQLAAQETLQSVTERGNVTNNIVTVGSFNSIPAGLPLGSAIKLTTPGGHVGLVIVKGDGAEGIVQRWDTYINTGRSYVLSDHTAPGATKDRFCIDSLGNIGINTIAPKERLSVRGKIRAMEIKVEANNWPDYVFKDDYQLPTLKEIERYIQINGHLKDMPSAKQVANDGIALGELNAELLKKIEELTLHLIKLSKEVEELKMKK